MSQKLDNVFSVYQKNILVQTFMDSWVIRVQITCEIMQKFMQIMQMMQWSFAVFCFFRPPQSRPRVAA